MKDRELERRLRALAEPAPPPSLRARLESGIPGPAGHPEPWWNRRRWVMATIGTVVSATVLIAAAIGLGLIFGPGTTNVAFAAVLDPVERATETARAVHLVLSVLTREGEDFGYVNLEGEPQEVEVWVEWPRQPGDPGRARIDKKDRIYVFDGSETVYYHPLRGEAFRQKGAGFGYELFWPAAWVRQIRNLSNDEVEVLAHDEAGGRGRLVLREKGTPVAPLRPSFLGEFDRETEIEWDLESNRLIDLRRFVLVDGERRLFSQLVTIDYRPAIDDDVFSLHLPENVRWGGVRPASSPELLELGPREVAQRFFETALKGDRESLELFCPTPSMVDFMLADENRPTEILFIGEPFRAGDYPGVFVPYRVRLGAHLKAFNLALRNDNEQGRWVYDGGI